MGSKEVASPVPEVLYLEEKALQLRRHVLRMAERVGQGYVGQGFGIADLLAVLYFGEMRYKANDLAWPDRDRFFYLLATIRLGLYAAWLKPE